MIVEQIYTGCLAQGAYYIESEGQAAVIDPLREVTAYIKKAKKSKAKIKYVFETHFHADFVSGHVDLAKKTKSKIVYGPLANPTFDAIIAKDGEEFKVGKTTIRVLHTPGHTIESTCYLLLDETGKERYLFTGDTLFIGDVGRPDLVQKAAHMSQEDLAGLLYESLNTKIKTLPDDVIVYPAHGAGSACGKNMSKETFDTLGHQKTVNYALLAKTKEQFIKEVTEGLTAPPQYFPLNVMMNKQGISSFDDVKKQGLRALAPDAFELEAEVHHALVLDTRPDAVFAKGFIPNSINIGLGGQFAPWVGELIPDNQPLLLVTEEGKEEETLVRLSRVGYDNTIGFLKGGIAAWQAAGKEIDTINRITATEFSAQWNKNKTVYDVRRDGEYAAEHVEEAFHRPLSKINEWTPKIDPKQHFYMHCGGGYRSMIAASILKARGIDNFSEIEGGFADIAKTGVSKTDFMCQSKKTLA